MKCARCKRPLLRAYVSHGPLAWGPSCAKAAGFTKPTEARPPRARKAKPQDAQIPLGLTHNFIAVGPQATQGHKYLHDGTPVIALESGNRPRVGVIGRDWLTETRRVSAADLEPLPMAYFQGQIPA